MPTHRLASKQCKHPLGSHGINPCMNERYRRDNSNQEGSSEIYLFVGSIRNFIHLILLIVISAVTTVTTVLQGHIWRPNF